MTGIPFCVLPVTSLNGSIIGSGQVGPIFTRLFDVWSKNTEVDIVGQIRTWDAERDTSFVGDAPTPYRFKINEQSYRFHARSFFAIDRR